jgi:hypothetical protein
LADLFIHVHIRRSGREKVLRRSGRERVGYMRPASYTSSKYSSSLRPHTLDLRRSGRERGGYMRAAEAFGFVLTYVCSHMRPEATTVSANSV